MASLRYNCETRLKGMQSVRQNYEADWRDIARFAQPARSRFLNSDTNRNQRGRNGKMLDEYGITSYRTLANGMTSGLSSPSRPWMKLGTYDDDEEARIWLAEVERLISAFIANSNFYGAAKTGYHELGLFGTEAGVIVEHPEVGIVVHSLTAGEYWIAVGSSLVPDTLYRRCPMTVRQTVQSFKDAASSTVRKMYDRGDYENIVDVFHAIEPDPDYRPGDPFSKPFRSVYWDEKDDRDKLLRLSGYHEKPFWAARWDTTGSDTYGFSPGMEGLPSLRELQLQVKRRNEATDKLVKPEIIVPPGVKLTGQPGNIVSASSIDKDGVLIPSPVPYQALEAIERTIERLERKIGATSFAELFMAITNMQGIQPRNMEEIASRNEEKLTQLGPTIERVNNEKLEVSIDRIFGIMLRGGMLPEPPKSIAGKDIKVEFISILTQMQRMVGLGQIERTVSFIGNLGGALRDALDKLDVDELVDEYADRAGTPARVIRKTEDALKLRQQRAQQAQAAKMAEMMPAVQQGADAARLLSEADVNGAPMLDTLLGA